MLFIQAIPAYTMSVFKFSIGLCGNTEKVMNNFWWVVGSVRNLFAGCRGRIRLDKIELVLGALRDFNLTMLGKQG